MPARTHVPTGAPIWVDLFTSEPEKAKAFYSGLFGWAAEEPNAEFGGYVNFTSHGVRVAGMVAHDGTDANAVDFWSTYLSVPDAAAAVEAAQAAGAGVYVPAMPVGDLGVMAVLADPAGATIGVWQPGTHTGYGRVAEAGAPCWHELHTRDYGAALGFYKTVFGWDTKSMGDTDDFRYTQAVADGEPFAGVMDASAYWPEGLPPAWLIYLGSDDVDATCAKAVELGGAVTEPPKDTPFGRLAQLADPTGAMIKINSIEG